MSARYNPFADKTAKAAAERVSTNRYWLPTELRAGLESGIRTAGNKKEFNDAEIALKGFAEALALANNHGLANDAASTLQF